MPPGDAEPGVDGDGEGVHWVPAASAVVPGPLTGVAAMWAMSWSRGRGTGVPGAQASGGGEGEGEGERVAGDGDGERPPGTDDAGSEPDPGDGDGDACEGAGPADGGDGERGPGDEDAGGHVDGSDTGDATGSAASRSTPVAPAPRSSWNIPTCFDVSSRLNSLMVAFFSLRSSGALLPRPKLYPDGA